ncbi:MAG TPA: AAA family ATPase [Planctomycetota bacterium]
MASRRSKRPNAAERALFVKRVALSVPPGSELPRGHPFDLAAVRHLGERELRSPVTVFVGENGIGKSTLLEALAVAVGLNPEGGSRNLRFATRNTHSALHRSLLVARGPTLPRDAFFLRAESFYNVASKIDALDAHPDNACEDGPRLIESYGGKSLHEQSHGESFLTLFLERMGGRGLYLLDEPEAALSPQRQLSLLVRMHDLVAAGSQFILATHSPILMAHPGADIWLFGPDGITNTTAAATEHWQITKQFLNDPEAMLRELFS